MPNLSSLHPTAPVQESYAAYIEVFKASTESKNSSAVKMLGPTRKVGGARLCWCSIESGTFCRYDSRC